jgi:hypothetical protein
MSLDLPAGGTVIACDEHAGRKYLKVHLWPAPDGKHYMSCADIAALHDLVARSPPEINGLGVALVFGEAPKP